MNMFHLVPAASAKLLEPLVNLTVKIERALILEVLYIFYVISVIECQILLHS